MQHLSLITDRWTSQVNEAYTAVTCHFIDEDWTLRAPVLITRSEGKLHTAENLAQKLETTMSEFGLEGMVTNTVIDNAKNVTNAVGVNNASHLQCFAHPLNLVVKGSGRGESCDKKR